MNLNTIEIKKICQLVNNNRIGEERIVITASQLATCSKLKYNDELNNKINDESSE